MATVKRRLKKKHVCSCGRSFAHAISLKRHRFVSGCAEVDEDGGDAPEEKPESEKAEQEEPTVAQAAPAATQAFPTELTVHQIAALRELAISRLEPVEPKPGVGERLWNFTVAFSCWLGEEAGCAGRAAAPHLRSVTRKFFSLMTWVIGVSIFVVGVHTGLTVKQAWADQNQPISRASDAAQTVTDFYRAINGRAYGAAYRHLSNDWRRELGSERFKKGYAHAQNVRCQLLSVQSISDREAMVEVELNVDNGRGFQKIRGHYSLVLEGGTWKLDNSQLTLQS